jgi:NAD(P)-dependent dehydrogenase (short-subunit alcohol dehydrogenase family)
MAKAALPYLTAHKRARIINVSKTRDAMFAPRSAPYGASKAALESMTLAFAQDLLDTGVTVNSLAPGGSSDTKLGSAAMKRDNLKVKTLLPPEIMVPPALWLASSLSDGVTGCRFVAKDWDASLPPEKAAEGAREAAAFLPPTGKGKLERTWKVRGGTT